jgi:peptide/nickel transport system ATP-binding protein
MSEVLLETKNLSRYFEVPRGTLHAVEKVNMQIHRGQTMGVVGESGCGKSTLGRVVTRLLEPTSGEVYFEGQNITAVPRDKLHSIRKKMAFIFQDPYSSLNPRMSVQELIAEPLLINKALPSASEVYKRVHELMEVVGLAERLASAFPHELDGGRRQRIGIARALALNPEFIVCDEPVSALDVSIQAQILNLLMDLQDEMGLAYMFVTHDLKVVRHISDDITVMYMGVCVERSPSKELFQRQAHPYTRALLNSILVPDLTRRRKIEIIKGEVTSPINPKPGCRFAPRCPYRTDICTERDQELVEIWPNHFVACEHPLDGGAT